MPEELKEGEAVTRLDEHVVEVNGRPEVEVDIDGRRRTLEPRPVYEFERDIVDDLIESSIDPTVTGAAVPIKGRWIHGWLNEKFDDYINNIWHGYQYFVKYVEAETSKIENISTHQRSPGTYDSMYRYLLVLEDLGLIDRYRREEVSEDMYDFNVPEEFRTRTFIRLDASYEGNENKWSNPIDTLYGGGEIQEVEDIDRDDESDETIDDIIEEGNEIEGGETTGGGSDDSPTMDDMIQGDVDGSDDDSQQSESDTDRPVPQSSYDLPDTEASITDFPDIGEIPKFIEQYIDSVFEEAFNQAPISSEETSPSDLELGRIAIVGPWAGGDATPGETPLDIYIGIKNTSNGMNVGFIPGSVNRILPNKLNRNNIFESVFPEYKVDSSYSVSFRSQLKRHINIEQQQDEYYDYSTGELKEVD